MKFPATVPNKQREINTAVLLRKFYQCYSCLFSRSFFNETRTKMLRRTLFLNEPLKLERNRSALITPISLCGSTTGHGC